MIRAVILSIWCLLVGLFCSINASRRDTKSINFGNKSARNEVSKFSCTFDVDYCKWTNDSKADFYWIRNHGKTPSDQTGPPWDHTTQRENQGYYLYIESSWPRKYGERVRIISPILNSPGKYCFSFWHHMHGSDVRDLNVYAQEVTSRRINLIRHLTGAWSTEKIQQHRALGGNEAWWNELNAEMTVSSPVQIVIEGVQGDGYQGDIAIDDISLKRGPCPSRSPDCSFENNTCGWTQMSSDDFNWFPNKGETHTRYTGPSADHTLGTPNGRYLYIESSWPRLEGDKAALLSPPITCIPHARPLFRFWFNMNGDTVGSLRVYVVQNGTSLLGKPLWHVSGEQKRGWIEARVPIPAEEIRGSSRFHIVMEGERKDYRGDIAIDDVSLTGCSNLTAANINEETTQSTVSESTTAVTLNETTTITPQLLNLSALANGLSCTFDDKTFCNWKHGKGGDFQWTLNQGKTTSLKTGPLHGHNTKHAWYAYIEASTPREQGDKAMLRSSTIPAHQVICLQFYYLMFGKTMGELKIMTSPTSSSSNSTIRWSAAGEQSVNETDWLLGRVQLNNSVDYDVIIEAVRGDNFYSDIGLDDITLTLSRCTAPVSSNTSDSGGSVTSSTGSSIASNPYSYLNCNFDEMNFCGWEQNSNDHFNFSLSVLSKTTSPETGPVGDHNGGGQFAFIEASRPRVMGDKASLQTPIFSTLSHVCVGIWYHMFGEQTGSLAIHQIIYDTSNSGRENVHRLWNVVGNIGNVWNFIQINLIPSERSRVVVEATVGSGWRGDIAIDDITFINGECPIFNCTFQTGFCGWSQDLQNDDFDWSRKRRKTPSKRTGPDHDHTYKSGKGYYLYIESSSPRRRGNHARLVSPIVTPDPNSSNCFRFWYHSNGRHVGSLNVYKRHVNDLSPLRSSSRIWHSKRDKENRWLYAQINIEDTSPIRLIFDAVRGRGPLGDIAIDDVTMTKGKCPSCCSDDGKYRCGNDFCVPASERCNGVDDCGDGSDETFCGVCGHSVYRPFTSRRFGTIRSDLPGSFPTVRGFKVRNIRNPRRVVKINPSQPLFFRLPRLLGLENGPEIVEVDPLGEENPSDDIRDPEIIRIRRKRHLYFRLNRKPGKTRRSNSEMTESNFSAIENQTVPTTSEPFMPNRTTSTQTESSRATTILNLLTRKATTESRTMTYATDHDVKAPIKLVRRLPGRISNKQWTQIRKTLGLNFTDEDDEEMDEEEEDEEDGISDEENEIEKRHARENLIRRIKRSPFPLLRIVGGNIANPHSWPWLGAYIIRETDTDEQFLCGATLIAPYWAITAAHCPYLGNHHSVVFGKHNLVASENTQQIMSVEMIFINSGFRSKSESDLGDDIALIKLNYPVITNPGVQPACLPRPDQPDFPPGYVCVVAGWGKIRYNVSRVEEILHQAEVPILSQQVCRKTFSETIKETMFCAGGVGSNTCQGDSGGPLICERNNTAYIVGATSWGDLECLPNVPGVYTKIKSYYNWIMNIIQTVESCRGL